MIRFTEEWLADRQKKMGGRSSRTTSRVSGKANVLGEVIKSAVKKSAHAIALALLDKNPDRIKGQQEHYEQVRVFYYFECHHQGIYHLLHSTPNGGQRTKATGGKLKAEGQKKGYPDMSLDAARGKYHGLRIELKYGKSGAKEEQKEWLNRLTSEGYYCALCVGHNEAIEVIMSYWHLEAGASMSLRERDEVWRI
ncbi:TPA: VRR-NUC domain-containing protein [Serratia marcescens]|uniref:VRR-NUC domain-containing protein n=1 Tax=Serratia TaxID=613 RepID=UPI001021E443|nr:MULTISPECIES: VRR-NUC domain-containing protein [Serratia]MBP1133491.1 hypothetical protein [Serratia sp. PL17]RYM67379.1 hypothetical protein BSQ99_24770 [Serratia liquefaciens]HBL7242220.1 VRR-NUC domain-containing protein [Serratia liquefaciens]HDS5482498.1 VRR-NUC domain-containing protein [Serratia liquefaciens]